LPSPPPPASGMLPLVLTISPRALEYLRERNRPIHLEVAGSFRGG
jgi:hypothetical protein